MMSPTSKGGWFISFAASGRALDLVGVGNANRIQRVGHRGQVFLRKMQVHGGVFELGMAQQHLDRAQIGPALEQVSRITVP